MTELKFKEERTKEETSPPSNKKIARMRKQKVKEETRKNYVLKSLFSGLPWWLSVKNLPANAGNSGLIPDPRRSHMPQRN